MTELHVTAAPAGKSCAWCFLPAQFMISDGPADSWYDPACESHARHYWPDAFRRTFTVRTTITAGRDGFTSAPRTGMTDRDVVAQRNRIDAAWGRGYASPTRTGHYRYTWTDTNAHISASMWITPETTPAERAGFVVR